MSYFYDEEAIYQDADIEQWEMEEEGRAIDAARKAGRCAHQGVVGFSGVVNYPEQEGLEIGQLRCTDGCKAIFQDDEDWFNAMNQAVHG